MIKLLLDFNKLFLVKDSEYGTHVTYTCLYPHYIVLNYFTHKESLSDIINELIDVINTYEKED